MVMGKDGEYRTERRNECLHLSVEALRQEVNIVLEGRAFLPIPEQTSCDETRYLGFGG